MPELDLSFLSAATASGNIPQTVAELAQLAAALDNISNRQQAILQLATFLGLTADATSRLIAEFSLAPEAVGRAVAAIRQLQTAGVSTEQTFGAVAQQLGVNSDRVLQLSEAVDRLGGSQTAVQGLAASFAQLFVLSKVNEFKAGVLAAGQTFENLNAQLKTLLQTQSGATGALSAIESFASKTPFQVTEVTEAYIQLKQRGIQPTTEALTQLGDIASSQGRTLNETTLAVLQAGEGEFERLRSFGIRASAAGDKVNLSFQGVNKQVLRTPEAIAAGVLSLGSLAGVAGTMADKSATLSGAFSNLQDNTDKLNKEVFNLASGPLVALVKGANSAYSAFFELDPILQKVLLTTGTFAAIFAGATATIVAFNSALIQGQAAAFAATAAAIPRNAVLATQTALTKLAALAEFELSIATSASATQAAAEAAADTALIAATQQRIVAETALIAAETAELTVVTATIQATAASVTADEAAVASTVARAAAMNGLLAAEAAAAAAVGGSAAAQSAAAQAQINAQVLQSNARIAYNAEIAASTTATAAEAAATQAATTAAQARTAAITAQSRSLAANAAANEAAAATTATTGTAAARNNLAALIPLLAKAGTLLGLLATLGLVGFTIAKAFDAGGDSIKKANEATAQAIKDDKTLQEATAKRIREETLNAEAEARKVKTKDFDSKGAAERAAILTGQDTAVRAEARKRAEEENKFNLYGVIQDGSAASGLKERQLQNSIDKQKISFTDTVTDDTVSKRKRDLEANTKGGLAQVSQPEIEALQSEYNNRIKAITESNATDKQDLIVRDQVLKLLEKEKIAVDAAAQAIKERRMRVEEVGTAQEQWNAIIKRNGELLSKSIATDAQVDQLLGAVKSSFDAGGLSAKEAIVELQKIANYRSSNAKLQTEAADQQLSVAKRASKERVDLIEIERAATDLQVSQRIIKEQDAAVVSKQIDRKVAEEKVELQRQIIALEQGNNRGNSQAAIEARVQLQQAELAIAKATADEKNAIISKQLKDAALLSEQADNAIARSAVAAAIELEQQKSAVQTSNTIDRVRKQAEIEFVAAQEALQKTKLQLSVNLKEQQEISQTSGEEAGRKKRELLLKELELRKQVQIEQIVILKQAQEEELRLIQQQQDKRKALLDRDAALYREELAAARTTANSFGDAERDNAPRQRQASIDTGAAELVELTKQADDLQTRYNRKLIDTVQFRKEAIVLETQIAAKRTSLTNEVFENDKANEERAAEDRQRNLEVESIQVRRAAIDRNAELEKIESTAVELVGRKRFEFDRDLRQQKLRDSVDLAEAEVRQQLEKQKELNTNVLLSSVELAKQKLQQSSDLANAEVAVIRAKTAQERQAVLDINELKLKTLNDAVRLRESEAAAVRQTSTEEQASLQRSTELLSVRTRLLSAQAASKKLDASLDIQLLENQQKRYEAEGNAFATELIAKEIAKQQLQLKIDERLEAEKSILLREQEFELQTKQKLLSQQIAETEKELSLLDAKSALEIAQLEGKSEAELAILSKKITLAERQLDLTRQNGVAQKESLELQRSALAVEGTNQRKQANQELIKARGTDVLRGVTTAGNSTEQVANALIVNGGKPLEETRAQFTAAQNSIAARQPVLLSGDIAQQAENRKQLEAIAAPQLQKVEVSAPENVKQTQALEQLVSLVQQRKAEPVIVPVTVEATTSSGVADAVEVARNVRRSQFNNL